ncbi:MAG: N-acetylmuramoyl-L-alanine amidase, partial [Planctomycetes bacterium]|nr:N-acetylmuramoyl-L-alanine amidase [Planctomycetota bacterium]
GQYFHTGTPVVLWSDPGGYDAYRTDKRFAPLDEPGWDAEATSGPRFPNRYSLREDVLTPEQIERVRGGGWDLPLVQDVVDLFVIHYDVAGTSRRCFKILQDARGLSVHFMLDIDGTIYQTLVVKERAWHAKLANARSVGIEITNIGAYPPDDDTLDKWYARADDGRMRITLPPSRGDGGVRTPGFVGRPMRDEPIEGVIKGRTLRMYDLTPEQYDSLIKLTATLCTVLPNLKLDYPRDEAGRPRPDALTVQEMADFRGLLGHYHVADSGGKIDPGPAFQWDRVIREAKRLLGTSPKTHWGAARSGPLRSPSEGRDSDAARPPG